MGYAWVGICKESEYEVMYEFIACAKQRKFIILYNSKL